MGKKVPTVAKIFVTRAASVSDSNDELLPLKMLHGTPCEDRKNLTAGNIFIYIYIKKQAGEAHKSLTCDRLV